MSRELLDFYSAYAPYKEVFITQYTVHRDSTQYTQYTSVARSTGEKKSEVEQRRSSRVDVPPAEGSLKYETVLRAG